MCSKTPPPESAFLSRLSAEKSPYTSATTPMNARDESAEASGVGLENSIILIQSCTLKTNAINYLCCARSDMLNWADFAISVCEFYDNRASSMIAVPEELSTWICTLVACSIVVLPAAAISPVAKSGPCPSGYSSQGSYCVPGRNAREVLPKHGACPSSWSSQGNYCVAGKNAHKAKPKSGPCPSGWSSQGHYCVAGSGSRRIEPKRGPCPSGWSSQGKYCVAGMEARRLIEKRGACPSAWSSQGQFCVAARSASDAILKKGACPSGWSSQGEYCVN